MGAAGLAAGIVLLLAALVLLSVLVTGLALLIGGAIGSRGRRSTSMMWVGGSLVAAVVVVAVATVAWVRLSGDPSPVAFDLREPIAESSLDKDHAPGLPGSYEYTSDHLGLVLPDGSKVRLDVDGFWLGAVDGIVTTIHTSEHVRTRAEAVARVEDWAVSLDVDTPGLSADAEEWETQQSIGDVEVLLGLTEHDDGRARVWLRLNVPE